MDILLSDIIPYLSERGVLEVNLALGQLQIRQLQMQVEELQQKERDQCEEAVPDANSEG